MFYSNLECCAIGVRAAENFGELNTAKPEKIREPFPYLRAERYVPSLSTRLCCVEPELLLPKRTHAALCMVHLYLMFSIAPLYLAWIFLYTHAQECARAQSPMCVMLAVLKGFFSLIPHYLYNVLGVFWGGLVVLVCFFP